MGISGNFWNIPALPPRSSQGDHFQVLIRRDSQGLTESVTISSPVITADVYEVSDGGAAAQDGKKAVARIMVGNCPPLSPEIHSLCAFADYFSVIRHASTGIFIKK
ncbi:hypothetical protein XELAEV_18015775mg [Xenopus laevis]|uniref:Uncharacterized protein n=1 Tax=Xenopus laevis TaxID=8355 RepID=A0A974DJ38_XENLA|nr:hypothetical protein XELAEV_18015775mg [Xenopus laevis]